MRKHSLLLIGSLMTLLGCSNAVKPGDLAVSIAVTNARSVIRSGDTLGISVTALNVGDHVITISGTGCPRPFRVYGPDDQPLFMDDVCALFGVSRELQPGDSQTFQFTWVAEKLTRTSGTPTKSPLPIGPYVLRGYLITKDLGTVEAGAVNLYINP